MSTLILIGILLAVLVPGWAVWSLVGRARRTRSYENEVNQRLRNICR